MDRGRAHHCDFVFFNFMTWSQTNLLWSSDYGYFYELKWLYLIRLVFLFISLFVFLELVISTNNSETSDVKSEKRRKLRVPGSWWPSLRQSPGKIQKAIPQTRGATLTIVPGSQGQEETGPAEQVGSRSSIVHSSAATGFQSDGLWACSW